MPLNKGSKNTVTTLNTRYYINTQSNITLKLIILYFVRCTEYRIVIAKITNKNILNKNFNV